MHALQACLAHAKSQGAERLALLADQVGYGAFPAAVVEHCQSVQAAGGLVLRGNHEPLIQPQSLKHVHLSQSMGAQTAQWTHDQLSAAQRIWLGTLPLSAHEDSVLLVHASAEAPER